MTANKNLAARIALTATVAAGTFFISASHIISVAEEAGNHGAAAFVYPVAIDAVILVSVLTLVAKTGVNRMAKWYATLGRTFGFAATIYANVAASGFESVNNAVINLIPALALIITMELLVHAAQATPATRARKATKKATVTPIRGRRGATTKHSRTA
jgi:hypothetical protein